MSSSNPAPSVHPPSESTSTEYQSSQRSSHGRLDEAFTQQWRVSQPTLSILFLLVLLVGAFLRLYQLGIESFSYDEGIMIEATSSGWATVMANLARGRPPLIVLLGFGWIQLVGESELAVRLLPALMGIISIGLIFRIGQMLLNDVAGLIAAAVLSISAFHLFHSQDYRYYSLLTLMTLGSTYFYLRCFVLTVIKTTPSQSALPRTAQTGHGDAQWQRRQWIEWSFYVLFSALVYYAHYQGVFALVAQGLFFLTIWFRVSGKLRWRWFFSQIAIGLFLLPSFFRVLLDFTAGSQDGDFQGTIGALGNLGPLSDPPFWLPFHTLLVKYNFISISVFRQWPVVLACGLLLLIGITVAFRQSRNAKQPIFPSISLGALPWTQLRFLILWALCPVFIPFFLSKILSPMYLPRYTISALPAVCLALTVLFIAIRKVVPLWASLGILLILSAPGIATYYENDYKDQWRIAAEYVHDDPSLALTDEDRRAAENPRFVFVSVNNETADRIQLLFGRYFVQADAHSGIQNEVQNEAAAALMAESCALSAGLAEAEVLPSDLAICFGEDSRDSDVIWMITRTAKEGPQLQIEDRLLASVPAGWELVHDERFSGVVARLYNATSG